LWSPSQCFRRQVGHAIGGKTVEAEAERPVAVDRVGDVEGHYLTKLDASHLVKNRRVHGRLRVPRHGEIVPPAIGDGVHAAAGLAVCIDHIRHLEPQISTNNRSDPGASHVHPEERVLPCHGIDPQLPAGTEVLVRLALSYRHVRFHRSPGG